MNPPMIRRARAISGQSTSASPTAVPSASMGPKTAHTGTAASMAANKETTNDAIPDL